MEEKDIVNEIGSIELRSDEVQEIMNRVPVAIVRWGITIIAIILALLMGISALVDWPDLVEVPCELSWCDRNDAFIVNIDLTPELLHRIICNNGLDCMVSIPVLDEESCRIPKILKDDVKRVDNEYYAIVAVHMDTKGLDIPQDFYPLNGKAKFVVSNRTLFQRLFNITTD